MTHYCRYCQRDCNCSAAKQEYCYGCYYCYTGGDDDEDDL